ncbi:lysophosphatidic acid receptor 6-like [Petromyzon marinus]|uniref:lysophosphatidic acid receptor 6-like n=1 Tax=Petromyzon marinus TaxID=7757 RepID=UPI003F72C9E2
MDSPSPPPPPGLNVTECTADAHFKNTFYAVAYSLVFVVGLCVNGVSCWVFCRHIKCHSETTIYMSNLVVSDLLFVGSLPLRVLYYARGGLWPFGELACKLSKAVFLVNMYGSVLFLTCICADRFLAIVHPLRSRPLRTPRIARLVSAAVWLFVALCGAPVFALRAANVPPPPPPPPPSDAAAAAAAAAATTTTCFENFSQEDWSRIGAVVVFVELVGFVIPLCVMVYCSCQILLTIRKTSMLTQSSLNKDKIQKMIGATLAIFVTSFLPHHVTLMLYTMVRTETVGGCAALRTLRTIYPVTLSLASANCCLDPVIYYFTTETFRQTLSGRRALFRKLTERRSVGFFEENGEAETGV